MESITLGVDGMSCGGCVLSVERALQAVKGVERARADLQRREAVVEGQKLDRVALEQALQDAGYDVRPG